MSEQSSDVLKQFDDIFGSDPLKPEIDGGYSFSIIHDDKLVDSPKNPYSIRMNDPSFLELYESIKEKGIREKLIVRPIEDGKYEIVSGHRRRYIGRLLGINEFPCDVGKISDHEIDELYYDLNIKRKEVPLSEEAKALKLKYDARKNQGYRSDLEAKDIMDKAENAPDIIKEDFKAKTTMQLLADEIGKGANYVDNMLRLTYLIPELQELLDGKQLKKISAVHLSHLDNNAQRMVLDVIEQEQRCPNTKTSKEIRSLIDEAFENQDMNKTEVSILNDLRPKLVELLTEKDPPSRTEFKFAAEDLRRHFPDKWSDEVIHNKVMELVTQWAKKQKDKYQSR